MTIARSCFYCVMLLVCGTFTWMLLEFRRTKIIDFNDYTQETILDASDDHGSFTGTKISQTAAFLIGRLFNIFISLRDYSNKFLDVH